MDKNKAIELITAIAKCVINEAHGSIEHISEYVSEYDMYDLMSYMTKEKYDYTLLSLNQHKRMIDWNEDSIKRKRAYLNKLPQEFHDKTLKMIDELEIENEDYNSLILKEQKHVDAVLSAILANPNLDRTNLYRVKNTITTSKNALTFYQDDIVEIKGIREKLFPNCGYDGKDFIWIECDSIKSIAFNLPFHEAENTYILQRDSHYNIYSLKELNEYLEPLK